MKMFKLDPIAKEIIKHLNENPECWQTDGFHLFLNKYSSETEFLSRQKIVICGFLSVLSIWIASGVPFIKVFFEGKFITLNRYSKYRIHRAFKEWCNQAAKRDKAVEKMRFILNEKHDINGGSVISFGKKPKILK